jgi:APA family basic amino acid/polyamine antiporter
VPARAQLLVGAVAATVAAAADLRGAIGFSSFCVLAYYAVANASALTLRRRPLAPAAGLVGCLALALTLPLVSVLGGAAVLAAAALLYPRASFRRLRWRR